MALLLKRDLNNSGVEVEYWAITDFNIDWFASVARIEIGGFLNQETRLAGKNPLVKVSVEWAGDDFIFQKGGSDNLLAVSYTKLKQSKLDNDGNELNIFVDAEDC